MLLQSQHDAVGDDGGQDHVLKGRGEEELRKDSPREGRSPQMTARINTQLHQHPLWPCSLYRE